MKIQVNMAGKPLGKLDFAMLRAGLAAAQATTPTAAASGHVLSCTSLTEALTLLFGDRPAGTTEAAALHGSFNPAPARNEQDDETQR